MMVFSKEMARGLYSVVVEGRSCLVDGPDDRRNSLGKLCAFQANLEFATANGFD